MPWKLQLQSVPAFGCTCKSQFLLFLHLMNNWYIPFNVFRLGMRSLTNYLCLVAEFEELRVGYQ